MPGKFVVSCSRAKDDPDRATVSFTLANAAVGSDQETVVFLSSEGVRLAVNGYADDIAEQGLSPLKELMTNFAAAGGKLGDGPFAPAIGNFYMTCPISRASATMAECAAALSGTGEATGTG